MHDPKKPLSHSGGDVTWKRELAFWTFMFFVAIWLMYGVVSVGKFVSDNWGVGVEIARAG